MKDKILKVMLIISSLPLIGVFIWAIYNAIFGTGFMGSEIYGLSAFGLTIVASFFMFVPVLPICIAYQLFYLIRYIVKNNKIDRFLNITYIIILILSLFSYGPVLLLCIAYQIFYLIRYKVKKDMVFYIIYILSLIVSNYIVGPFFKISKAYQYFYIIRYFIKKHKAKNVGVAPLGDPQNKN